MSTWIPVSERPPEDFGTPYQVLVICVKKYELSSSYPNQGIRRVQQDWVVRTWPNNFTHWMVIPPLENE